MTALYKIQDHVPLPAADSAGDAAGTDKSPLANLFAGGGAHLFSSGSVSECGPACLRSTDLGEGLEMFSSGSAPHMGTGSGTSWAGEDSALFSSGSAPKARGIQSAGDLVALFSSGS